MKEGFDFELRARRDLADCFRVSESRKSRDRV